jgi:hypothetical protein
MKRLLLFVAAAVFFILIGLGIYTFFMHSPRNGFFYRVDRLNEQDRRWANALLEDALDHEGLYTLLAEIKPISTIQIYSLAIGTTDTLLSMSSISVAELVRFQRILDILNQNPHFQFVLNPFKQTHQGRRFLQLTIVNRRALDQLLNQHKHFWRQWGFVPGSEAGVIITTVEFEEKFDRYRAYGYLFGYPKHAVDFYVDAARQFDATGIEIPKKQFDIPTYSEQAGRFAYDIPIEYQPTQIDWQLYNRSMQILDQYREVRKRFTRDDQVQALDLIESWYQSMN